MAKTFEDKQPALNVSEVLQGVYNRLGERNNFKEVILPQKVLSEIADDSDYHRTKTGYMAYEKVRFFDFNNKSWLIGNGKAYGDYPKDPYNSDILALEMKYSKSPKKVFEAFLENVGTYFRNSLLHARSDGTLVTISNRFSDKITSNLSPEIDSFIAEESKYNNKIIDPATFRSVNTRQMTYKPSVIDFLAENIENILKSY
ncbi:MAG: hypothetical protein ACP5OG_02835 [Candidatus Nanoarchaeia archaeon]